MDGHSEDEARRRIDIRHLRLRLGDTLGQPRYGRNLDACSSHSLHGDHESSMTDPAPLTDEDESIRRLVTSGWEDGIVETDADYPPLLTPADLDELEYLARRGLAVSSDDVLALITAVREAYRS